MECWHFESDIFLNCYGKQFCCFIIVISDKESPLYVTLFASVQLEWGYHTHMRLFSFLTRVYLLLKIFPSVFNVSHRCVKEICRFIFGHRMLLTKLKIYEICTRLNSILVTEAD